MPVVAYDRLIEKPDAFYITFDNKEVGRMQARGRLQAVSQGQLRDDQGLAHRPERRLPAPGQKEVIADAVEEGRHQDRR